MQRELGEKTGENLWLMAHGRDHRVVQTPKPRKSLGAEVNWGIRFRNQQDADQFLLKLSGEVCRPHISWAREDALGGVLHHEAPDARPPVEIKPGQLCKRQAA